MNVPIYQREVGISAQQTVTPQIEPITQAAFGENVSRAIQGIGAQISDTSEQIANHLLAKKERENEQSANDATANLNRDIDNLMYGKDGYLSRQGINAKGITAGEIVPPTSTGKTGPTIPKPDPNSFVSKSEELRQQYAKGLSGKALEFYDRLSKAHLEVRRNAVMKHEATQMRQAEEDGIAARITNDASTFAIDGGASKESQALYEKAKSEAADLSAQHGEEPATAELRQKQVADQFLKSTTEANLEYKPDVVKKALDTLPASPEFKAKIQAMYDGRMIQSGIEAIRDPQISASLLNPDQTYNAEKVTQFASTFADSKGFSLEQKTQLLNGARSEASRINSAMAQQREQNQAQWYNNVIRDYNALTKQNPISSPDALMSKYVLKDRTDFTGYAAIDTAKKSDFINSLFSDANKARESALAYLSPAQKAALSEAEIMADGKLGKTQIQLAGMDEKQSAKDVYMNLIKQKVSGSNMTHDEIIGYANDLFKNVTVKPGWIWDTTQPAYQTATEKGQAYAISFAELEKVYGRDMVQKAQSVLGGGASPASVNEAIRRALKIPESKKLEPQKKGQPLQGFTVPADIYRGNKI